MFPTERAGEPGAHIHYDRVKTKIGIEQARMLKPDLTRLGW